MITVINTRLYPACHCGDIQAINNGNSHVHINLQYKNVDGGKGKGLVKNHAHQIQKYIYKKNMLPVVAFNNSRLYL